MIKMKLHRKGSILLEILAVLATVLILVSILFRVNQSEIAEDLSEARARETATRELWLIRMDSPQQTIWMWTDENGAEWVLFGESNRVYCLGENDG